MVTALCMIPVNDFGLACIQLEEEAHGLIWEETLTGPNGFCDYFQNTYVEKISNGGGRTFISIFFIFIQI